jgi:hypothetical protein
MVCEAEDPTGYLLALSPLVFGLGKLGERMRNYDMFIAGWFVVLPLDPPWPTGEPSRYSGYSVGWIEYGMDCAYGVGKWEVVEVGPGWKNPRVSLADVIKDPQCWIHD